MPSRLTLRITLCQQCLNGAFSLGISAFANVNIADVAALVDQVQGRPVAVLVGCPGDAIIVLRYCVGDIQIDDGLFQVVQVFLIRELWIVVADDDQALVFVFVVPLPQRGNYVLAVNSAKGPHLERHNLAAQVGQSQRGVHIQPDFVG